MKNPDLKKKIMYTLFILFIFRLGSVLLVPYADTSVLGAVVDNSSALGMLNVFSGGALSNGTLFALSVQPYITASIVTQLLTIAIPALERMSKEGENGKRKLTRMTKYLMVVLALVQGFGYYSLFKANGAVTITEGGAGVFAAVVIVLSLTAGSCIVIWLGDRISDKGIGNGVSIILATGILASLTSQAEVLYVEFLEGGINYLLVPLIILLFGATIVFIIFMTQAERRIPVAYAKRVVGRKMSGGQTSYIPIKVSMTGVMPIIFAMSILNLPSLIMEFAQPAVGGFWDGVRNLLLPTSGFYAVMYLLLIVGFNYFYVAVQYNPIEIANNIKANNGAIPGIRPGKPTSLFISRVLSKITLVGAMFLGIIAVGPIFFNMITDINIALSGTSIIIIVGVALDTLRQIESQLVVRHHKGFLG